MKLQKPLQLAFQGSYSQTQVCLQRAGEVVAQSTVKGISSSSQLIPLTDQLLKDHKLSLKDLDFFSVNQGPGAFTSLRVAIVTVNTLAFASGIPIMPVCGLEALFAQVKNHRAVQQAQVVACLLTAYSGQFYVKFFQSGSVLSTPSVCVNLTQLADLCQKNYDGQQVLFVGNFNNFDFSSIKNALIHPELSIVEPTAQDVAGLALSAFSERKQPLQKKVIPAYIKPGFV